MSTNLGRIRPAFKGAWNSETSYSTLDIVHTADGSISYAALQNVPAGTPLSDSSYWTTVIDVSEAVQNAATSGGYYTPAVNQSNEGTMTIAFTPSSDVLPELKSQTIALPAGYTPVRGTDYWTDDDRAAINSDSQAYITDELAKRAQLAPEFANSIDDCTDTSKLYVLPDGYLYAYTLTETAAYTNQIPISTDDDGSVFGWIANRRVNSSGSVVEVSGYNMTGYIPCTRSDVLRLSAGAFSENTGYNGIALFDSDKAWLNTYNRAVLATCANVSLNDDGSAEIAFTSYNFDSAAAFAYVRVWGAGIGDDAAITVNEEISDQATVTQYAWTSTGHAFVPADYESRIVSLESGVAKLQSAQTDGLPDYAVTEAESAIDRILAAQGARTFTLAVITDMHYGNGGYADGVQHACGAMKYIDRRVRLDAVAVLGDYTDGYPASGLDNALSDMKAVNCVLDDLRFSPNLRLQGNHDYYTDNFPVTHRLLQSYSDGASWGDRLGGYFLRDFDNVRLRVIALNTVEEGNDYVRCSAAQYQWFADALNLSEKSDAADWSILILSHHPLDWYVATEDSYRFCYIVDAYVNGTSWTDGTISCDYSGKNAATLIGNIHGHVHNLLTDYVHFGNVVNGSKTTVLRMCTPEACTGRENQYTGAWAEETSYPKTASTAEDTSFCVYCIDLEKRRITAVCYGAGYDREIEVGSVG